MRQQLTPCIAAILLITSCVAGQENCHEEYFDTGITMTRYCLNKQGERDGAFVEFYSSGDTSAAGVYHRDSLDGLVRVFHENGRLHYEIEVQRNRLLNVRKYYDQSGIALDPGTIRDGNGVLKQYSASGRLRAEGEIVNGLRQGEWTLYSNSKTTNSMFYESGRLNGEGELRIVW